MATEVSTEVRRQPQVMGPAGPETAPPLPCPRCHSSNTKFCYYNNYNSSQPRHFCKSCRRYWTHGGTLRDIPVGGGTRKSSKRSRTASHSLSSAAATNNAAVSSHSFSPSSEPIHATPVFVSASSFTSLLNSGGLMGLNGFGLGLEDVGFGGPQRGGVCWSFPHEVGLSMMSHSRGGGDQIGLGGGLTGQGENVHADGQGQGYVGLTRGDTWHVETGGDCCFASSVAHPELAISTSVNGLKSLK